jgi:hypothetical protein
MLERAPTRSQIAAPVLAGLLLIALGVSLHAILPLPTGIFLAVVFAWVALPGVVIARRVYGAQRNPWLPALLVGPVWGFGATSIVVLLLWVAGVRNVAVLALTPLVAMLAAIPCGRLAGSLRTAEFSKRDLVPLILVLALVPLVNGRPFARVGEMRPEGKAYRAYFIADFEWAMTVVSEVSKGDVPPHNPFLAGDQLHYYWLMDLLPAVEYRAVHHRIPIEPILLYNTMLLDLGFVAFLYFFVRHFVQSPAAAAVACFFAVLFTSFEGVQQLYVFWKNDIALAQMRTLNIDAISNWKFGAFKIDGLQRLLLYQPQHATAWALSLSSLLLLLQSRDNGRAGVNVLAGSLLALALMVSSFIAVMVGGVVALYQLSTLAVRARWKDLLIAGVAGGIPAGIALLATSLLHYVDSSGGQIVFVGTLNPLAVGAAPGSRPYWGFFLSFGPIVIAAIGGALIAVWRGARQLSVVALIIAVSFFFYFFVDVVDHQHAYVAWRAGHLLFIAFAPLVGFAWQDCWARGGATRVAATAVAVLLAVTAAPTMIVDLYNTQDTDNQLPGIGFRWTEIVTPDELQALEWVKTYTPPDALVQVDPIHGGDKMANGVWAYMPAFGERRETAGTPISMIPLKKYQDASERVRQVFAAKDAASAHTGAADLKLEYLYIGPVEQRVYHDLRALLDSAPYWFKPVFRNNAVTIYKVT